MTLSHISEKLLKPRRFMSLRRSKSSSRSRRRLDSSTRRAPTSRRNPSRSLRAIRCRKSTRSSLKEEIFVELFQFHGFCHSIKVIFEIFSKISTYF